MKTEANVLIYKENETYLTVISEYDHILQEISDYFTIEVPGAKFMPAYKKGWDGKLRLFNKRNNRLYLGLFSELIAFLKQTQYTFLADNSLKVRNNITEEQLTKYIDSLQIPYTLRDYQFKALQVVLKYNRAVIQSSTGSGKSLIIYTISRYFDEQKVLIVVPTISLTVQLYKDFEDYSQNNDWEVSDNVHVITAGVNKNAEKNITISTWQSIYEQSKEYFEQFSTIIIDETHGAKSNSLKRILENATKAYVRVGLTGTLQDTKTHLLTIQGLLGEIYKVSSTADLQSKNILSDIETKMVLLSYGEKDRKTVSQFSYQQEVDFLLEHKKRNKFLLSLIRNMEGNTLVLASYVEKQGEVLYTKLKKDCPNRAVFFVYGDMPKEEREEIRQYTEHNDNVIIIATYGVFSTGINIKKLHNIVFALAGKSKIRNLQSIGRGLRKHSSKSKLTLYDISDDLSHNNRKNYSFRHFEERYKQYIHEKFEVSFRKVPLYTTVVD